MGRGGGRGCGLLWHGTWWEWRRLAVLWSTPTRRRLDDWLMSALRSAPQRARLPTLLRCRHMMHALETVSAPMPRPVSRAAPASLRRQGMFQDILLPDSEFGDLFVSPVLEALNVSYSNCPTDSEVADTFATNLLLHWVRVLGPRAESARSACWLAAVRV
jgi:hypothetical protein